MSEVKRQTKEECIPSHKLKRRFYCERMFNKCFPPTTSESYSKLNGDDRSSITSSSLTGSTGLLKRQFCDPLECDGKKVNHIEFTEKVSMGAMMMIDGISMEDNGELLEFCMQ